MKSFRMLNIPMMLLGLGAALILSRTCKAQSEIAPDHFDGTDSWAASQAAPHKAAALKLKQTPPALQARNHQTDSVATLRLAAKRASSLPAQTGAIAIQEKPKTASSRKPKKP
jgi:hypothetical protein